MQYFNEIFQKKSSDEIVFYIYEEVEQLVDKLTNLDEYRANKLFHRVIKELLTLKTAISNELEEVDDISVEHRELARQYRAVNHCFWETIDGAWDIGVKCSDEFINRMETQGFAAYMDVNEMRYGSVLSPQSIKPAPHTYNISKHLIEKIYSKFNDLLVSVAPEQWEEAMLTANFKGVASQCPKQKLAYLISCIPYQLGEIGEQWYKDSAKSIDKTPDYCSGRSNKIAKVFKKRCDLLKDLSHQL